MQQRIQKYGTPQNRQFLLTVGDKHEFREVCIAVYFPYSKLASLEMRVLLHTEPDLREAELRYVSARRERERLAKTMREYNYVSLAVKCRFKMGRDKFQLCSPSRFQLVLLFARL